jgi:hypothetical protein
MTHTRFVFIALSAIAALLIPGRQGFATSVEVMGGYGQDVTGNVVSGYDIGNLLFGRPLVKARIQMARPVTCSTGICPLRCICRRSVLFADRLNHHPRTAVQPILYAQRAADDGQHGAVKPQAAARLAFGGSGFAAYAIIADDDL